MELFARIVPLEFIHSPLLQNQRERELNEIVINKSKIMPESKMEPKPESRIENPVIAQIVAYKQERFIDRASHEREEAENVEGTEDDILIPYYLEQAEKYDEIARVVGEGWQQIIEKENSKGNPLPLTEIEEARFRHGDLISDQHDNLYSNPDYDSQNLVRRIAQLQTYIDWVKARANGKDDMVPMIISHLGPREYELYIEDDLFPGLYREDLTPNFSWAMDEAKRRIELEKEKYAAEKAKSENPEVWDALREMYGKVYGVYFGEYIDKVDIDITEAEKKAKEQSK